MELNGYYYYANRKSSEYKYYQCARKSSLMCPGSIKVNSRTGEATIIKNHSGHDKEVDHVPKFRAKLIKRAMAEWTPFRRIYEEEAARDAEAASLYPFKMAENAMNSARRRNNPPIPNTLIELGELMLNPEWSPRFVLQMDSAAESMLKHIIKGPEGVALLFSSQTLIDGVVNEAKEIHVDVSFKFVPTAPPSSHLLVIHLVLREKTIPLAFCLMQNRTQALYERVFQSFVTLSPTLRPVLVVTDYETALRTALLNTYPQAEVVGCYYHYTNALWKKAVSLGYIKDIQPDMRQCLKMLMALPFAPSDKIIEGFLQIREWADNRNLNVEDLFAYMQSYWIQSIGSELISVFDMHSRTNYNVELFKKKLQSAIGVQPNIFYFIGKLKVSLMRSFVHCRNLQDGVRISRPIPSRYLSKDIRIKDAQRDLQSGHTLFHFLETVALCVDSIAKEMCQAANLGFFDDAVEPTPTHNIFEIITVQLPASTSAVSENSRMILTDSPFREYSTELRKEESGTNLEVNGTQSDGHVHFVDIATIKSEGTKVEENHSEIEENHSETIEKHFDFLWNNTPKFPNEFWSMNKVIDNQRYIVYSKFMIQDEMPVAERQIMVKSDLKIKYFVLHKSWNTAGFTDMLTCAQEIEEIIHNFDVLPICKEEPNDYPEEYTM